MSMAVRQYYNLIVFAVQYDMCLLDLMEYYWSVWKTAISTYVQIICKYASTSRWRWQHWSSDLHSDPQGRRKVGGVSSNVVGTICPPVEIELTDLSKFGSGCMTSQPSCSDSPDVDAVLCWLDYWADQPRRRKNVHNFKEDQLVLYSTVAVPYSKWKKWCPLPKVQSVQMQTVKNDCRSCRGSLYSIGPLPA